MSFLAEPIDRRQRRFGAAILIGIAVLLLALGGRLVHINTTLHHRLATIVEDQQAGRSVIPARRGTIFDARGRVVATSRLMPDVFVDPGQARDIDTLAQELGARVNLSPDHIREMIKRRPDSRFIVVATKVDEVTARAVRAMGSPAVGLTNRAVRTYPLAGSLAHVLGFVGRDGHGLDGLELTYDGHLAGMDGVRATIRDARRRALWRAGGLSTPPTDGGHVVLTIDAEIQRIVEEALFDAVTQFEAESGVAIVISPTDGEILAMACVPTFDPNHLEPDSADRRRNRAVTDPVEPGSTFKPFIACGALEGRFITPTEQIDCRMGAHRFGHRLVKDVSPHGLMDLAGIVTKSSNIGMGFVAERMGNDALHAIIRRFGFGDRTGIECPGEDAGLVRALGRWNSYSAVSVSFGYEIAVTPLQLITAYAALLNDGVLYKPRLIGELLGPDGEVLASSFGPEIVGRAVSSQVARYMSRTVLLSVVEDGGGHRAKLDQYRVLGKTGTAKLSYRDRPGYEPDAYLSTFVGAAPADDPAVLALVMVRRPNPALGYYGGVVSAPAVGRILAKTLAYLDVPPDRTAGWAGL